MLIELALLMYGRNSHIHRLVSAVLLFSSPGIERCDCERQGVEGQKRTNFNGVPEKLKLLHFFVIA